MRIFFIGLLFFCSVTVQSQELYVFSEPASNMPARSLSVKQNFKAVTNIIDSKNESRYTTELMFGLSKNWMVHGSVSLSDMYSSATRFESAKIYAKYRFLSDDDLYSHFRMSLYTEGSYSRNAPQYDELSMDGDQTGIQTGIIATKLIHKLAISATGGITQSLQPERWNKSLAPQPMPYSAVTYSLSAGYLVLPKTYDSYHQTNLNLYVELLGQNATDLRRHYLDLAPAAQLIFNSEAKLNVGYRFQLDGNMYRMANKGWLISFEWVFLNAL